MQLRLTQERAGALERALEGDTAELTIGRGAQADWRFDEEDLSRLHARFVWNDGRLTIEDLESRNGTAVNDRVIDADKPVEIGHGDKVQIGPLMIAVDVLEADPERTVHRPIRVGRARPAARPGDTDPATDPERRSAASTNSSAGRSRASGNTPRE